MIHESWRLQYVFLSNTPDDGVLRNSGQKPLPIGLVRNANGARLVLLLGESGTGKEVLAQGIHALSGRAGPLVAVSAGASWR